ncbi:MAG: DOMON domain-containing protein, partial [Spirochaetota bacterium]
MQTHRVYLLVCSMLLAAAAPAGGAPTLDGNITEGEYDHVRVLGDGAFTLAWSARGEGITFGMSAQTEGWVAVGIDPVVVLDNADIVYGWVDDRSGEARVIDAHSLGAHGPTPPDTSRGGTGDIIDFAGIQRNGVTTIEFSRLLDTGDPLDAVLRPGDGNKLIWMYARTDDYRARYTEMGYTWLREEGFAEGAPGGGGLTMAQILLAFGALVLLSWGLPYAGRLRRRDWWPAAYRVFGYSGAVAGLASGGITLYVNILAPGALLLFPHILV